MELTRKLERPDFEGDVKGVWCDPDPLPMEAKKALWALLPKRMAHTKKVHFLYRVGESTQTARYFYTHTAPAIQVAEIETVRAKARALLQSLAALSVESRATLKAHAEYLAVERDAPVSLSPAVRNVLIDDAQAPLIGHWWDGVQDIESAAAYAAAQVQPSKTTRPAQANAKRLVYLIAEDFYRVTGRLPPASKEAWFTPFAGELGRWLRLAMGGTLVRGVLEFMEQSCIFPPTSEVEDMPSRAYAFYAAPANPPD